MTAKLRVARRELSHTTPDERSDKADTVISAMPTQPSPWMTITETCRYLRVSRATLWRLRLPKHLAGASPRYHREEVDRVLLARGSSLGKQRRMRQVTNA